MEGTVTVCVCEECEGVCVCVWHRKGEMYLKLIVNNGHTCLLTHT